MNGPQSHLDVTYRPCPAARRTNRPTLRAIARYAGLAIAGLLATPGAWAQTYYVSTEGNDHHNGSLGEPFRTLQKAADTVRAGDTIEVMAGTYRESVRIGRIAGHVGAPDAWITLKPYNGKAQVRLEYFNPDFKGNLDTTNVNTLWFFPVHCDVEGDHSACVPMYWRVEDLDIGGGPLYAVKIEAPRVQLLRNKLHDSGADVIKLVKTAADVVIDGNEIFHPKPVPKGSDIPNAQAIDIVGAPRTVVTRNYIHDIPSVGLFAKGNARNTLIENNRLERIYGRAIQLGQSTDADLLTDGKYETYDGIVRNNLIKDSEDSCLATASSQHAQIYGNVCINVAGRTTPKPRGAIYVSKESTVDQAGTDIVIHDNVIVLSPKAATPFVQVAPGAMTDPSTLKIDRNLYWHPKGKNAVTFNWEDKKLINVPFAQWRERTQLDLHSRIAQPDSARIRAIGLLKLDPQREP